LCPGSSFVTDLPIEITCKELSDARGSAERVSLIDCREPAEHEIVHLEGATLIPMGETPSRVGEIAALKGRVVVYCHHGMRSLQVAQWLRANGVPGVQSLAGGIDAWAVEIDPSAPRY